MTTFIIVLASAALVYLVGLPLVEMVHEEKERTREEREGRHD